MQASKNQRFFTLAILLAPFLLLAPVFLTGKALFWGTPALQFIPWQAYAWETLLHSELPLWNPWLGMGAPLIANYQSALFYPPNWLGLAAYALGGVETLAWLQAPLAALHLAWAGWGMARLARKLGLDPLPQVVAGLAFALGGFLVARLHFLSITFTVAWLPWVLLGTVTLVRDRQNWRAWFGLAASLGMMLLAGHAQLSWYTLLLAGLWAAWLAWQTSAAETGWQIRLRALGNAWLKLAGAGLLALALSAVQLLPTAEYLLQSQRARAIDFETGLDYSFWPWHFLTLLAPGLFGSPAQGDYWGFANYWEDAIYIGLLPALLAVGVLLRRIPGKAPFGQRAIVGFFRLLLPLTILLALGENTPVFPWLYQHIPTFDMFNAPARWIIWLIVGLALLAGFGVQRWRRPTGRSLYWTRLATMGALAVSLGAGLGAALDGLLLKDVKATFLSATALAGLWGVLAGGLSLLAPPDSANGPAAKSEPLWWSRAVVLVVGIDLLVAGWGLNPGIELNFYRKPSLVRAEIPALAEDDRLYIPLQDEREIKYERFLRFDTFHLEESWRNLREMLLPNLSMLDGIRSANNFDPLLPGNYSAYIALLEASTGVLHQNLLNRMGVDVVEEVDSSSALGIKFTRNPGALERVRWVPCAELVSSAQKVWERLSDSTLDPAQIVILEAEGMAEPCQPKLNGNVWLMAETASRLQIQVNAPVAGWLVVADTWYPGWQAHVDGRLTEILPADGMFRAIAVPAGEHQVELLYRPISFRLGALLSLLSLIAWLCAAAALVWRTRAERR